MGSHCVLYQALYFGVPFHDRLLEHYATNKYTGDVESMLTCLARDEKKSSLPATNASAASAPPPQLAAARVRVWGNGEQASESGGGRPGRGVSVSRRPGGRSPPPLHAFPPCPLFLSDLIELGGGFVFPCGRQDDDTEDTRREAHGGFEHGAGPRKVHLPRHGAHLLQRPLCYLGGEVR